MGKRIAGAALAALVVAAAVLAVALTQRPATEHEKELSAAGDPVVTPGPRTIVRHGVTYTIAPASPAAAVLDPAHPRTVTVYATDVEQPEQPECTWMEPTARLVDESETSVRIATFDYTVPADGDEPRMCGYRSDSDDQSQQYQALEIELAQPLGDRRLIDEKSGKVIGQLDADYVPTPAYVPPGFEEDTWTAHFTPADSFVAMRQYHRRSDASSLEIHVRSATAWGQSGKVIRREQVGGAEATVTDEGYQRCMSWSPGAGLVAEVCSLADSFLPADELLRIARSIPALPS